LCAGFVPGELGPSRCVTSQNCGKRCHHLFGFSRLGANLVTATSAEYRFPLSGGTEAAAFFDLGSGLVLPNWAGPDEASASSAQQMGGAARLYGEIELPLDGWPGVPGTGFAPLLRRECLANETASFPCRKIPCSMARKPVLCFRMGALGTLF